MDDQHSAEHNAKLFGFSQAEWTAADAIDVETFNNLLETESMPGGPWPNWWMITGRQWLLLARLSRGHAARVLQVIGPTWQEWATARRARIPELTDPDLQRDFLGWARGYELVLEELRSLANTDGEA